VDKDRVQRGVRIAVPLPPLRERTQMTSKYDKPPRHKLVDQYVEDMEQIGVIVDPNDPAHRDILLTLAQADLISWTARCPSLMERFRRWVGQQ